MARLTVCDNPAADHTQRVRPVTIRIDTHPEVTIDLCDNHLPTVLKALSDISTDQLKILIEQILSE